MSANAMDAASRATVDDFLRRLDDPFGPSKLSPVEEAALGRTMADCEERSRFVKGILSEAEAAALVGHANLSRVRAIRACGMLIFSRADAEHIREFDRELAAARERDARDRKWDRRHKRLRARRLRQAARWLRPNFAPPTS